MLGTMRMIDIHCHLLPDIDDGARNLDQALAMARAAVDDGIEFSVMTPHIHPGRYENTRTRIDLRVQNFRNALQAEKIPLEIGMAAEVRLAPEILQLIEQDEIPFYGTMDDGCRLMLLEFPHSNIPPGSDKFVERLLAQKIRPVIAHPERNKDVIRDLRKLEPFIEMGCMLQLTASSVAGRFGKDAHRRALQILEFDVFKVLASDAHNLKARMPQLREGRDAAAKIIGEKAADDLVYANPMAIVKSQITGAKERDSNARQPLDGSRPVKTAVPSKAGNSQETADEGKIAHVHHWHSRRTARPDQSVNKSSVKRSSSKPAKLPWASCPVAVLSVFSHGQLLTKKTIKLDGRKFMIGRKKDNDLVLRDEFMSRHHALLAASSDRLIVSDLNSTNGIRVNGNRRRMCELNDGDRVSIGGFEIEVRLAETDEVRVPGTTNPKHHERH